MLTPNTKATSSREMIPMLKDYATGLFYIIVKIPGERLEPDESFQEENSPILLELSLIMSSTNQQEPSNETIAVTMQQLHERTGHASFDTLRSMLQYSTRNLKITGPMTLAPCQTCSAIKIQKFKWPLRTETGLPNV